jgi:hypothetical protein
MVRTGVAAKTMAKKKSFPLRLNEDLWSAMQDWSKDEYRSVNGQIEFLLREALWKAGRLRKPGPPKKHPDSRDDDS